MQPVWSKKNAVVQRFLDVIFANMETEELLALHEQWDSDRENRIFHRFTDRLAKIAPEHFGTASGKKKAAGKKP